MNIQRIQDALDRCGGTHELIDILDGIRHGYYRLMENATASMVVEAAEYPRKKRLHIFLASGDLDGVIELGKTVQSHAKDIGAEISIDGRKGWSKVLRKHGFDEAHTTMIWRP